MDEANQYKTARACRAALEARAINFPIAFNQLQKRGSDVPARKIAVLCRCHGELPDSTVHSYSAKSQEGPSALQLTTGSQG
jgi:hypothetical protein